MMWVPDEVCDSGQLTTDLVSLEQLASDSVFVIVMIEAPRENRLLLRTIFPDCSVMVWFCIIDFSSKLSLKIRTLMASRSVSIYMLSVTTGVWP